jgi:subtilisin family serine protease
VDTATFVPGGCTSTITVAAIDESLRRAPFSNYGSKVDVAAPGVGIYSTYI